MGFDVILGSGQEPKIDKKRARGRKSASGDGAGSGFCRFFLPSPFGVALRIDFWRVRPCKILLFQQREHDFEGSGPPKIGPQSDCERQQQEKTTKTASGDVSGRTFSAPGPFFVDFGAPAGSQDRPKTAPSKNYPSPFWLRKLFFCISVARVCSGWVPDAFWRLQGPSRTRFREILGYFFAGSVRVLVGICWVPPGCCRDPHAPQEPTCRGWRSGLNNNFLLGGVFPSGYY